MKNNYQTAMSMVGPASQAVSGLGMGLDSIINAALGGNSNLASSIFGGATSLAGLAGSAHSLYNRNDPDYYEKHPYMAMASSLNAGQPGLGGVMSNLAPMAHMMNRSRLYNQAQRNNNFRGNSQFTPFSPLTPLTPRTSNNFRGNSQFNPRMVNSMLNNPSKRLQQSQQVELDHWAKNRSQQQGELNYWNQKKELDHWNNQRNQQFESEGQQRQQNFYNDPERSAFDDDQIYGPGFAKGGPAKQYYVREKMPGYDVGRVVPHMLANYLNPRLDPAGIAGNVIGGEAARGLGNYGINRLMGTDGHQWSAPRQLTRTERFKRFFTHRIPKTINKTFGTSLDTGHSKYWNAAKGLPPAIRNNPGLLEQGAGALRNKAADIGSRVHQGIGSLGNMAYDNIIPPVENMGKSAYNAMPEIRKPIEQRVNHAASSISPFSRSGVSPWDMDPNFKGEEQKQAPSYLSQMYNSLPNVSNYFLAGTKPGKAKTHNEEIEHIQRGMKPHYPNTGIPSASDRFVEEMLQNKGLGASNPYEGSGGMNDNDEFFDARDQYPDEDGFYESRQFASGGYTGNLAPDEFIHRRHHRVNEPSNLDQMIRAYIQHMMEQQA